MTILDIKSSKIGILEWVMLVYRWPYPLLTLSVVGYDINQTRIDELNDGNDSSGEVAALRFRI